MRDFSRRSMALALAIGAAFSAKAGPFDINQASHGGGALPPKQSVTARARPMAASAAALPPTVNLTQWAAPVLDQGSVNSCVAWTVAHGMLGWYTRKAGLKELFAPMYMYSQINVDGAVGADGGSYLTDAMKVVLSQGNDVRNNYWQGDTDFLTQPTDAERESAKRFKYENLKSTTLFAHWPSASGSADNVYAIKRALANGQPVAIGMQVRTGFERLYARSPRPVPIDDDTTTGVTKRHAVLALGYDEEGLLIQNSWSTSWGLEGYGRLSWNKVLQDVYEAVVVDAGDGRPVCSIGANTRRLPASGGYLSATAYCAGNPTSYKWKVDGADFGTSKTISATLGPSMGTTRTWTVSLEATNAAGTSETFIVQLGQDAR